MYIRQILRTQVVGSRTFHLHRLHRVCGAEVAALKINSLIFLNILFSLAAAEHFDSTCPTSSGGGCGKPAVPHHQEVWFIVLYKWLWYVFVCVQAAGVSLYFVTHRDHCAPKGTR